jgi:hypothetical protein
LLLGCFVADGGGCVTLLARLVATDEVTLSPSASFGSSSSSSSELDDDEEEDRAVSTTDDRFFLFLVKTFDLSLACTSFALPRFRFRTATFMVKALPCLSSGVAVVCFGERDTDAVKGGCVVISPLSPSSS